MTYKNFELALGVAPAVKAAFDPSAVVIAAAISLPMPYNCHYLVMRKTIDIFFNIYNKL